MKYINLGMSFLCPAVADPEQMKNKKNEKYQRDSKKKDSRYIIKILDMMYPFKLEFGKVSGYMLLVGWRRIAVSVWCICVVIFSVLL